MSKVTDFVEKLSQEREEFKNAYAEAKLQGDFVDILFELQENAHLTNTEFAQNTKKKSCND